MNRAKPLLTINGALVIFLILMLIIKPVDGLRDYNIYNHFGESGEALSVYGDISLTQEFICTEAADSIELYIKPANDSYHGRYRVSLFDGDGNEIYGWITDKLYIEDSWVQYRLKGALIEPDVVYRLLITAPELNEDNAIEVAVGNSSESVSGVGELHYDAESATGSDPADKTVEFGVYRHRVNIFAILAFLILFATVNYCIVFYDKGTEHMALPVLIGAALIMFIILAPGCGPDDRYHYYSSLGLSNIMMGRHDAYEIENKYRSDLPIHRNTNTVLVKVLNEIRYRVNGEEGTFAYDGVRDEKLHILPHIVQALGITLGRLLRLNFIQVYTLARIFNMSMYIALIYFAVKLIPVNKELMIILGIMPMAMQQATQLSYDALVNGISFVFAAYLFRIVYEKKTVGWKENVILTLLMVILSPIKVVYCVLALLMLLIPRESFASVKDRVLKVSMPLAGAVLSLIVSRLSELAPRLAMHGVYEASDGYSMSFVLSEPVRFVWLLLFNFENGISEMVKGMVGGSLAGMTIPIPEYLTFGYLAVMLLCSINGDDTVLTMRRQRMLATSAVIMGIFALLVIFSFAETHYGKTHISGMQGRYLIPFLPPLFFCYVGRKIRINVNSGILFTCTAFIEMGLIATVMSSIDF